MGLRGSELGTRESDLGKIWGQELQRGWAQEGQGCEGGLGAGPQSGMGLCRAGHTSGGLGSCTLLRERLQLGAWGLGGARDSRRTEALEGAWIGSRVVRGQESRQGPG